MLTPENRNKLNQIVDQMVKNKESEDAIKFVVSDFKKKYENVAPQTRWQKGIAGVKEGFTTGGGRNFIDPFIGAGKGVLSTLSGVAELGQRGLRAITPTFKTVSTGQEYKPEIAKIPDRFIEAKGGWQEAGKTMEQIGEYFLPSSILAKGGKAINTATKGSKLLTLLGRSGMEAATMAGITALQEGEINKNVGTAAKFGAAIPVVGAVASAAAQKVAPFLTKRVPSKLINYLIKTPSKEFMYGKNPGLAVAQEGLVANSIDDLASKISARKKMVGKLMDAQAKSTKGFTSIQNEFDDVLKQFVPDTTDQKVVDEMNRRLEQLLWKTKVQGGSVVKIAPKNLKNMTADELWKFQQKVGELAGNWTGNASIDQPVNQMFKQFYGKIGKALDRFAGMKNLQSRYANLLGAEKAITHRVSQLEKIADLGFTGLGTAGLGALLSPENRGLGAFLGFMGSVVAKSAAFRTRAAAKLSKLGQRPTGSLFERIFGPSQTTPPNSMLPALR